MTDAVWFLVDEGADSFLVCGTCAENYGNEEYFQALDPLTEDALEQGAIRACALCNRDSYEVRDDIGP